LLDLLVKNGLIVDGSGKESFRGDLGVKDGRIACIGDLPQSDAAQVVDAAGKVVAPGFIDTHSHSELRLLAAPVPEAKIRQGITTEILGQDGLSVAPVRSEDVALYRQLLAGLLGNPDIEWNWSSLDEYFTRLEEHGIPLNVAYLIPHGMLRIIAMGMENRPATAAELQKMKSLLNTMLDQGALGLSTGMIYPPCSYASDEELVELTAEVAKRGGNFVIHMRNEGQYLLESLEQTLDICRKSGVALHVSHLKAFGRANWHKPERVLELMDIAAGQGQIVTGDQYPYIAGSTLLTACLPQWTLAGGTQACLRRLADERDTIKEWFQKDITVWDNRSLSIGWENIVVSAVKTADNRWTEGLSIAQIAERRQVDPVDALCDLLLEEELAVTHIMFYGCEENVRTYMTYPNTMICTDGIYGGRPHPRLYGSFPRVLGRYCRELGLLRLEEAVYKMTGLPAATFGLRDRGRLAPGYAADITIFDPATILDNATFEEPEQYPVGIDYVIVNGAVTLSQGNYTGATAGHRLTRA
jgi:N-acyl-D-amino-acid deacylase